MTDITDIEQRIAYALERIGKGLDAWPEPASPQQAMADDAGTSIEVDVLKAELEAERVVNAQLTERVRAIKDKQETHLATLERKVIALTQQLEQQGAELQRQRVMNASLTGANQRLSIMVREGMDDPSELDAALATELEAMRLARSAEIAEMEEIMAELKPLIGEVA